METLFNILKQFKVQIFYFLLAICALFFFHHLGKSFFYRPSKPETTRDEVKANYRSDMNFIECLAEQHNCLYRNIENNTFENIIENCKSENFCAELTTRKK